MAYADRLGIDYSSNIKRGELFDLIIIKTGLYPKPRFQFTLRKLLLWTTVVALLLGTAKTLGTPGIIAACWITIVGSIRMATNWRVAGVVSVMGGTVVITVLVCVRAPVPGLLTDPFGAILGCVVSGVVGACLFGVTELLYHAVDWIDILFSRVGVKPDGPTHDD